MSKPFSVCMGCGKIFRSSRRGKEALQQRYCSRDCKDVLAEDVVEISLARKVQRRKAAAPTHTQCVVCGAKFDKPRKTRFCSSRCRWRDSYVSARETNPFVAVECVWCGKTFMTNFQAGRRRFCSTKCIRALRSNQRTHMRRGVFVMPAPPLLIYKRDGGTCGICGEPIKLGLPPNHPEALSIDHIVPLARGGTHQPSNVQPAHRRCNVRKGARVPIAPCGSPAETPYDRAPGSDSSLARFAWGGVR